MSAADIPTVAYYRGDDGYALDRAAARVAERIAAATGAPPERWRTTGAETNPATIAERVATAPMFGGGTVAIVVEPGPLLRAKADREALEAAIQAVAPGNALVFLEPGDPGPRRTKALAELEATVLRSGGEAKAFPAPREGQLPRWIADRAAERGVGIAPAAARELARRVGGFVREGDVDRQRMGSLAVNELDKLALYRIDGPIGEDDVRALVPEVIPDSTWALTDAIADRRAAVAGPLLDRLLETQPEPVILAVLHRRLRELIEVADHLAAGASPGSLVRTLGLKPFRADTLARQARRWTVAELTDALDGLLELDAMVKGAADAGATGAQRRLAFAVWVRDRVGGG